MTAITYGEEAGNQQRCLVRADAGRCGNGPPFDVCKVDCSAKPITS